MKKSKPKKKVTFTRGGHTHFPHKLTKSLKESKESLELLFALQRIAYPELKPGYRMNKSIVKLIRRK